MVFKLFFIFITGFVIYFQSGIAHVYAQSEDEKINFDYIFQDPPLINPRPAIDQLVKDKLYYYADENIEGRRKYFVYDLQTGIKENVNDTATGVYSVRILDNGDAIGIIRGDFFYKINYIWNSNFSDAVRINRTLEYEHSHLVSAEGNKLFFFKEGNVHSGEIKFITPDSIWFQEIKLTGNSSDSISYEIIRISPSGDLALIAESNSSGLLKVNYPVYTEDDVILNSSLRGPRKTRNFIFKIDWKNSSAVFSELNFLTGNRSYIRDALFFEDYPDNPGLIIDVISNDSKERNLYNVDLRDLKDIINPEKIYTERDNWIETTGIGMQKISNEELIFSSETNGWHNLYKYNLKNNNISPVAEGKFEIYEMQIDRIGNKIYYIANKEHPSSYKIYETDFSGSYHRKISLLEGNYKNIKISRDGNKLTYLYSEILSPDELYYSDLQSAGGREYRITNSISSNFSSVNWQEPEIISYKNNEDGETIYANLYRNKGNTGKTPLVMFAHGAGYMQNVKNGFTSYIDNLLAINYFIKNGYTVLDVDYRGSSGYGKKFRNKTYRNLGYWEISDFLSGIEHLDKAGLIDRNRVSIYGGSYGGFIALKAAFEYGDHFTSAAAMRAVSDWKYYFKSYYFYTVARLDEYEENKRMYEEISPFYKAGNLKIPLFILHGMEDDNVLFQDFVMLTDKLIREEKDFDLMIYPKEKHNFRFRSSWKDSYKRLFNFFERTLK
jgi:dipeptidyl aminopeptidase/acylaminoacyl peptidase